MGSVVGDTVAWSHSNKKAQPEQYASRLGSGWHKEIVRLDAAMKSGDPDRVVGLARPFGARQAIARLPLMHGAGRDLTGLRDLGQPDVFDCVGYVHAR
jgi:hypothetical protein